MMSLSSTQNGTLVNPPGRRVFSKCPEHPRVLYASEDGFIKDFLVASERKSLVSIP